ncbi:MAG: cytochrome P450 [Gammaproteobacteria bacterium]
MALQLDTIDIHRPQRYAEQGFPWGEWDMLRREAPVFWYERDDIEPFWAVTRYDEVMAISGRPEIFINGGPRLRLALKHETELLRGGIDAFGRSRGWDPQEPPDLTFMDDPRHRQVRKASSWAFTQGCMRAMAAHFDDLARGFAEEFQAALERATANGETLDFVHGYAAKLPLAAVGEIMGLPDDDWKKLLLWSEAIIGEVPPEQVRPGETLTEAAERNMNEFREYLEALVHEHRQPGGGPSDFINRLIEARVQGEPMNDQQLIGYLFVLIGAGNDTTRNATAGGFAALLEHPEQRDLLCANPDLLPGAVDEVLRWTSPVISFLRTATEDFNLAGTPIKAGETVCMFYPSANRDESHFADPYKFDISRSPNDYLTFGYGAHFCLGTNLARAELASMLRALIPVLPRMELAAGATRIANTHVSGYSSLPVRAVPG